MHYVWVCAIIAILIIILLASLSSSGAIVGCMHLMNILCDNNHVDSLNYFIDNRANQRTTEMPEQLAKAFERHLSTTFANKRVFLYMSDHAGYLSIELKKPGSTQHGTKASPSLFRLWTPWRPNTFNRMAIRDLHTIINPDWKFNIMAHCTTVLSDDGKCGCST